MPTKSKSLTTTAGKAVPGPDLTRMRRSPTHPGEIFWKDFLEEGKVLSQRQAALRMGMSTIRLNQIVKGNRGVTSETAVLFGMLTRTNPQMWLHLQADYDLWHELQRMKDVKVEAIA